MNREEKLEKVLTCLLSEHFFNPYYKGSTDFEWCWCEGVTLGEKDPGLVEAILEILPNLAVKK